MLMSPVSPVYAQSIAAAQAISFAAEAFFFFLMVNILLFLTIAKKFSEVLIDFVFPDI